MLWLKELFKNADEKRRDEWVAKVKGMISVTTLDDDAFICHMLVEWSHIIKDWCEENCEGEYIFGHFNYLGSNVYFDSEEDAMAFKLRWG